MSKSRAARLHWIDSLKGISIVLVVFLHSITVFYAKPFVSGVYDKTLLDSLNYFLAYNLAPLRMPLFFFISGFLANSSIVKKSWDQVVHSRIGLYLYVFTLWAFIQNVVFKIIGGSVPQTAPLNTFYASNFYEFLNLLVTGRSGLWYLYALILYFLVTKIFKSWAFILLSFGVILSISALVLDPIFPYKNMAYCYLFFVIGAFWGKGLFASIEKMRSKGKVIFALTGGFILVLSAVLDLRFKLFESFYSIFLLTVFVLALYHHNFRLKTFEYIGKNTLPVYIIHRPILELLTVFTLPIIINSMIFNYNNHLLFSVATPISICLISVASSLLIWKLTNVKLGRYLYNYRI